MKSSIVLLGLASGLGLTLYFLENRTEDGENEPVQSTERAIRKSRREAVGLKIRAARDGETLEFERDPVGQWSYVEPIRDRASNASIDSMFQQLEAAQLTLDLEPEAVTEEALRERGLDRPVAQLDIEWADATVTTIEFGETALSNAEVYLRRNGSKAVFRTTRGLRETVTSRNRNSLRDRRIFETAVGTVRRLRMTRDYAAVPQPFVRSSEVDISVQPNGRFDLTTDTRTSRAVPGDALQVLQKILGLRATGFPIGVPEMLKPVLTIEIDGGVGSERVDIFPVGEAFLASSNRRPVVVGVERGGVDTLMAIDFERLRARALWTRPVEDFDSLRVEGPDQVGFTVGVGAIGQVELQRPVRSGLDGRAIDDFLAALRRLVALPGPDAILEDPDLASLGLEEGAYEIQIRSRVGGRRNDVVRIGKSAEGRVFGRRLEDGFTVEIPAAIYEILERPWTDYLDRQLLNGTRTPSSIRGIRVIRGDERKDFRRESLTGSFAEQRAEELVYAILDAQARSIRESDVIEGQEPFVRLQMLGQDDRLLVELGLVRIDREGSGESQVFGRVSQRDGLAFELDLLLVDAIEALR
ncbi:MAG: DUF4340 domain-containing protein [Planctomycetota bacterium]